MSVALAPPEEPQVAAPPDLAGPPDTLYEVVDGRIVEKPSMSVYSVWIATIVMGHMIQAGTQAHGRSVIEVLFDMNPPNQPQRRPDLAFVSYERWPRRRRLPDRAAWRVVPELAVEVISPSNTADEVLKKIYEYFDAGVRLVWVIYPSQRVVYVYQSPTQIQVVSGDAELDGAPVLAGFRLSLATLFDAEADTD